MFPGTEWGCFGACEDEVAERDRSGCDGTEKWNGDGRPVVCDVAWLKAGLCPVHTLSGSTYPPPILWMEICCFQWFTRMIRYKVLLGKDLDAESSQERTYEPFGFVEQSGTFHSSNSRIVDWRKIKCKR